MSKLKVKYLSRLIYGKYPYAIQISHDALRLKNLRWRNRGSELHKVDAFMYKLDLNEVTTNKSYFGEYQWGRPFKWDSIDHFRNTLASWDQLVDWVDTYKAANPGVVGRMRHEGNTISFFSKDDAFCQGILDNFPDICKTYQRIPDEGLLPVMEKAAQEKTWLLQREYVDHYPYGEYKYRVYLSWEGKDSAVNLVELFRNYEEADLVRLSSNFRPLLAGTGRLRFPAHILIKSDDVLELVKLALGPTAVQQIVEYVLLDDAHSSP